jgi:DNA-binding SARP family transcriptional activator
MVEVEPHEPPAARRAPVWRAHAFGPSHVFVDDRPLSDREWTYAKAKELFFYLLLHPTSTKARIGLDLWPDASPAQLRSAFHRTMHHLRRALGSSESVSFDGEAYSLNLSLPHASDLEDFERHLGEAQRHLRSGVGPAARRLAAEEIEQALALDRGDFLEDLDAGDWTILPREDLRRRSLEARLDLGELYFSDAQYARAADTYRRVIRIDPYLETAHRELIRCLARLGEIGQAVKHFEDLRRRLRLELNTRPAAETAFLVERLRRGDDV